MRSASRFQQVRADRKEKLPVDLRQEPDSFQSGSFILKSATKIAAEARSILVLPERASCELVQGGAPVIETLPQTLLVLLLLLPVSQRLPCG